jgi:hypothetical protein
MIFNIKLAPNGALMKTSTDQRIQQSGSYSKIVEGAKRVIWPSGHKIERDEYMWSQCSLSIVGLPNEQLSYWISEKLCLSTPRRYNTKKCV